MKLPADVLDAKTPNQRATYCRRRAGFSVEQQPSAGRDKHRRYGKLGNLVVRLPLPAHMVDATLALFRLRDQSGAS